MTKDIYTPKQGEAVQIGQPTNSFSISLTDELLNLVKMSRVRVEFLAASVIAMLTLSPKSSKITKSDLLLVVSLA